MAEALGATFLGGSTLRTEIKWTPKAPPKVGQIDLDEPVQDDEPLSSQAAAQHLDQGGDVHGAGNPTTISGEDGDVGKGYLGLIVDLFKPGGERQLKYRDFRREFGGDDKKRLQSGIDRNDLDLVYQDLFNLVDSDKKGYVKMDDVMRMMKKKLPKAQVDEAAREVGVLADITVQPLENSFAALILKPVPEQWKLLSESIEIDSQFKRTYRPESVDKVAEAKNLPRLSEDKVTEMTELFNLYDREGTGKLSLEEFEQALQSTWEDMPSSQEVQSDFNAADSGSKGFITLQDFINWLQKTMWVDFQDLAKGASHGYSRFSSKVKVNRRDGLLGFVSDKTLVEITAKKVGKSRRPNFANEFAAQQARSSRCASKFIGDRTAGTLNRPIGPVWRPRVSTAPRRSQSATPTMAALSSRQSPMMTAISRRGYRPMSSAGSRLPSTDVLVSRTSSACSVLQRPFSPLQQKR